MAGKERNPVPIQWWLPGSLFLLATVALFGEFIFSDRMLHGDDILALGYMGRDFFAERLSAGDFPLWAPRLLGGVPTLESISAADGVYPTSLLYFVMDSYRAVGWRMVVHVLAAGFFMYGWARSLGLSRVGATVGGLGWLMAPVMVTLVLPGNDGKLMVAALTPLVFWATEAVLRAPSGRTVAGMAGAVAVVCLVTQFQTAYFLFGSAGAYALFRGVRMWRSTGGASRAAGARRALLPFGVFLGASLLGGGIAAFQVLPAASYVGEFSRRTATTVEATPEERIAYSSSWSFHPEEAVSLVVPEFVGNSNADAEWARGTYWGRNAIKLNHEYLGVSVVVLALFGLLGRRGRGPRWFMAGMSGVWLLYALGTHTPVWRIFYEVVPGMSLFRVPAICMFLVSFGVTTLFAMGVDDLAREAPGREPFLRTRRGRVVLGFVGLLLLGALLQASGALTDIWTNTIYDDAGQRQMAALEAAAPFITRGFGIAFLIAGLAGAGIWAVRRGRIPLTAGLAGLAALVAVDLGRIDRAFIRTLDFHAWAAPDENIRFLQARRDGDQPFRVADLRGSEQNVDLAMHGLDILVGHHPNDLARYRTLLGLQASVRQGSNSRDPNVLRIMNVKYLAWPLQAAGGPPWEGAQAVSTARTPRGVEAVYAYPGLDKAWLVGAATVLDDDAALARILSAAFDPSREAVLAEPASLAPDPSVTGTATWELNDPDERRLRVTTTGAALLVVSENWFPGWVADIDGEPAEVRRANLTLQAVEIPSAGEHTVTLRFTAPTVKSALRLSIVASAITVLLFGLSFVRGLPAWLPLGRRSG
ncbi:MAG: hypothetical protein OXL34_00105 [Gemmatimonadota bacterium]|nr:hypothetical protein [Gemmatimonadota bacterium]